MSSNVQLNEKDTPVQGLTIPRPSPVRQYSERDNVLSTIEDVDSTHSITPTSTNFPRDFDSNTKQSPFSPFYSHQTTRNSLDAQKSESKQNIAVYETDVETGMNDSKTNVLTPYSTLGKTRTNGQPCTVWPGRQQLKDRRNAMKLSKGWHPLARFPKRTRIIIKVLIGLILIGLIVGVGVGITKAVGGGVWQNQKNPSSPQ